MTEQELFDLGVAYGLFSKGDIDAGIHMVLPVCDPDSTVVTTNAVFQDLIDQDFYDIDYPPGYECAAPKNHDLQDLDKLYQDAITTWAKRHNISIGR